MKRLLPFLFLAAFLLAATGEVQAVYKYVDENGRTIFVDDQSKIPARFLNQSRDIDLPEMSEKEKNEQAERLRKAREKQQEKLSRERRERAEQESLKQEETPIVVRGNQVLVPIRVGFDYNTADVVMLLDTGASVTVFHRDALDALGIGKEEGQLMYGTAVGGIKVATRRVRFQHITVGPYEAKNVPAYIIDNSGGHPGYDGLLGMDFLRHIPYEVDFGSQVIRWQKP